MDLPGSESLLQSTLASRQFIKEKTGQLFFHEEESQLLKCHPQVFMLCIFQTAGRMLKLSQSNSNAKHTKHKPKARVGSQVFGSGNSSTWKITATRVGTSDFSLGIAPVSTNQNLRSIQVILLYSIHNAMMFSSVFL